MSVPSFRFFALLGVFVGLTLTGTMNTLSWANAKDGHEDVDDWHTFTYFPLAFAVASAVWVGLAPAANLAGWRGTCVRLGLRGSMIGAVAVGTAMAVKRRFDHDYVRLIHTLIDFVAALSLGAAFGALLGGVVGVIWGTVRHYRERRRTRNP